MQERVAIGMMMREGKWEGGEMGGISIFRIECEKFSEEYIKLGACLKLAESGSLAFFTNEYSEQIQINRIMFEYTQNFLMILELLLVGLNSK